MPGKHDLVTALRSLGPRGLRYVEGRVAIDSRAKAVTYTRDDGRTEIIRLLSIPSVLGESDVEYARSLCLTLGRAHEKVAAARRTDPELARLLPLEPDEEEWLALAPPGAAPVIARWDMNIDPRRGGAKKAQIFEMNGCAIGGIHYAPMSSEIVDGVAASLRHPPTERSSAGPPHAPADMRELWRAIVGPDVAWMEDRSWTTGITEGPSVVAWVNENGGRACIADPRDVRLKGDELHAGDTRVEILYRAIELRDLVAIEREEKRPLAAMREAVRRRRVISSIDGDLDHKSLLEAFSSPRYDALFTQAERSALRAHVPWTRLLYPRRTEDPAGRSVDLPEYARARRAQLVIKPNRSCGGEGILIGRDTKPAEWEQAISAALSGEHPAVVQALVRSATLRLPVARPRDVAIETHYLTYGLFATPRGAGILGRAAPFPVVNVSRGGGLLGVLVQRPGDRNA